jgi:hypothetical protein
MTVCILSYFPGFLEDNLDGILNIDNLSFYETFGSDNFVLFALLS